MNTELLWELLIKGSMILIAAGVVALFLSKSSGARRHLVWLAALATILLLPLASLHLPAWTVTETQAPIVAPLLPPKVLKAVPPPPPANSDTVTAFSAPITAESSTPKAHPAPTPVDLKPLIFNFWAVGCIGVLAWTTIGMIRVAWLVRVSTPVKPEQERSLEQMAWGKPLDGSATNLLIAHTEANKIRVLICPKLAVPATTGLLRPVILLPKESLSWAPERLKMVLAHETAHVKRRDWLWQTVAQLACAIHFFNPLVWLASSQMRRESEAACDDFVIGLGIEPTTYAQELLDIARSARFEWANSVSMARNKSVEHRLRSVLDAKRNRKRVTGFAALGALALSLLLALPIAALQAKPGLQPKIPGIVEFRYPWVKKLPQIPWVPSPQVEPNVYLAKDGVVGLPNGFRVRLVGAGRKEGDMWGLDGKQLPDPENWRIGGPYWQGNVFQKGDHGIPVGGFGRQFIVEVESDRAMDAAITSRVLNQPALTKRQRENPVWTGVEDQIPEAPLAKNDPAYAFILIDMPKKTETATYRVAIAGTNWKTVSIIDNPIKKTGIVPRTPPDWILLSDDPKIRIPTVSGNFQDFEEFKLLPEGQRLAPNEARRVILYDKNGEVIAFPPDPMFGMDGALNQSFKPKAFAQVDKIVLQTSPYVWAEFRDVPLHPNFEAEREARLEPHVTGTATGIAPGFSKTLNNGVTVSLSTVRKAAQDGKDWFFSDRPAWRADGKVLAKAEKTYSGPQPVDTWGTKPLVRFDLQFGNIPDDAETVVEPTGDIDPTFWLNGDYAFSGAIISQATTAYQDNTQEGGVKVGVATGKWSTVTTVPVDIPEEPPIKGDRFRSSQSGITMTLGEIPEFRAVKGKKIKLTSKPDRHEARRFVAVLKSGKEQTLTVSGRGIKGMEVFDVPARHGEQTEIYNDLITSNIKAIKFQTRPYEWVEFKGIKLNPTR